MKIRVCKKIVVPLEIQVQSSSTFGLIYNVVTPTILNDAMCECPGFVFRGKCSHIEAIINEHYCEWHDVTNTPVSVCPECGGPAIEFETEPEEE